MRCQVCDFGTGVDSVFRTGIKVPTSLSNRVSWSKRHKMYLCTDCSPLIQTPTKQQALMEEQEEINVEIGRKVPTVSESRVQEQ